MEKFFVQKTSQSLEQINDVIYKTSMSKNTLAT